MLKVLLLVVVVTVNGQVHLFTQSYDKMSECKDSVPIAVSNMKSDPKNDVVIAMCTTDLQDRREVY